MEFWIALNKVLSIVTFLVVGTVFLGSGQPLDGNTTGFHLITDNGGFFPHGLLPALVLIQGVVFAFASIEMVGTAAGECKDPQTMVPKAINSVIWRIGLFYVGSVVLLVMLLPWSAYQAGQSPFVTFFSKLGVPYIGSIMNIVVLTAALSSLNSGLYCTGRILRSMAMGGSAPSFMAKMSRQHVPYAGILATLVVYVVGVFLNYLVPSRVFEIVLNFASLGIIASWAFIIVCQMRLRKAIKEGKAADVSFKLPGAPFTSWLTLLFLLSVLVLMAFDYPNGTYTIAALPIIGILLVAVGVSFEVKAGVVVLAGEGVVLAVCKVLPKIKFGYMKVGFDVTLVVIACILSIVFTGRLQGVREGTVAAALLVGLIAKQLGKLLARWKLEEI